MSPTVRRVITILLILAIPYASVRSVASEREQLIRAFDEGVLNDLKVALANPITNEKGGIAWGRSYQLSALAEMLDATRDPKYADLFVALGRQVADNRDTVLQLRDEVRDEIVPAWGSKKYSSGKHYVWAVHTGMIAEPMARFAAVVLKDTRLSKDYSRAARYFLYVAERAMAVHDDQWREGPSEGEGYIYGLWLKSPLPLNQQNAPGRAYLYLYDATGDSRYLERARKLGAFFKNRLRVTDDEAYVWSYRAPLDGLGEGLEDVSHAAINVDFAVLLYEHGIVFADEDVSRFCNTLLAKVIINDSQVANNVGGEGTADGLGQQVFRWGGLARHSDSAYRALLRLYSSSDFEKVTGGGPHPLGIALLVSAATERARD